MSIKFDMSAFYVFVVICFFAGVLADSRTKEINSQKGCPKVTPLSNFDLGLSLGRWYFTYATMNYTGEKCSTLFGFNLRELNIIAAESSKDGFRPAYMKPLHRGQSGTYHFESTNKKNKFDFYRSVLGSDYKNYMVFYWCHTVGDKRIIDASILTRKRGSKDHLEGAFKVAAKNGLKREDFHYISSQSCPPK